MTTIQKKIDKQRRDLDRRGKKVKKKLKLRRPIKGNVRIVNYISIITDFRIIILLNIS